MNIVSVSSPVYSSRSGNAIRCTIQLANFPGTHNYVAVDGDLTSQTLYDALKAGTYGAVAAYVAPVPPVPSLDELKAATLAAVHGAANSLIAQVAPTSTRLTAFQNAAALVGPGGVAPTSGPLVAPFAQLAATFGMSPTAFAALALGVNAASFSLAAAENALGIAVAGATDAAGLAGGLAQFEEVRTALVDALNAGLPFPLPAQPPIVVVGVNG